MLYSYLIETNTNVPHESLDYYPHGLPNADAQKVILYLLPSQNTSQMKMSSTRQSVLSSVLFLQTYRHACDWDMSIVLLLLSSRFPLQVLQHRRLLHLRQIVQALQYSVYTFFTLR